MSIIIWIPTLILLVVACCVYWSSRQHIHEVAQALHNSYVFSMADRSAMADGLESISSKDPRIVSEAVPGLIDYARELNPDWIAGVNPGGRVLSAKLASEIGLDAEKCFYIRADRATNTIDFVPDIKWPLTGKLLIVDDISRSGDTLAFVKSILMQKNGNGNFQLKRIDFVVLVLDFRGGKHYAEFAPDWAGFKTDEGDAFRFPWSDFTGLIKKECQRKKEMRAREAKATGIVPVVEEVGDERLAENFEYAEAEARKYIGG